MIPESDQLRALEEVLRENNSTLIESLWNSPKALLATLAQQATGKHVLILTGASKEEALLFHDFPFFTDAPVIDFPAWETLPEENTPPSPDIVGERYQVLERVLSSNRPHIILTSLQASLQRLISPEVFRSLNISLQKGDEYPYDFLVEQLQEMGYERSPLVSDKGQYALRGGIIDVFPVSSPDPYRIEFFGDEIDSLRIFDPIGQKTVRSINSVTLNPAKELEFLDNTKRLCTIFDYLGPNTLVIFDDLVALEDRYTSLVSMSSKPSPYFLNIKELLEILDPFQKIFWPHTEIELLSEVKSIGSKIQFEMFNKTLTATRWFSPFLKISHYLDNDDLLQALAEPEHENENWTICCSSELEETNFQKKLIDGNLTLPKNTKYHIGYLSSGFVLPKANYSVLPLTEITKRYKIRRQKHRSTYHTPPQEAFELKPGDIVVHLNNGIGRYIGLEKKKDHNGVENEFFLIEYANSSKLFVPINQAHLLTKYIGASEEIPKMHELGSKRWQRVKEKAQKQIIGYAKELLDLYAKRSLRGGTSFPEDTPDMQAFEDEFPFQETQDQLNAIANVKKDMCSANAMDRLICGDVGYGKTEVAMRAAFKSAFEGGMQVAVLVPTTFLAMQHYENFIERMQHFPLKIAVLSRFQSASETRRTLEKVANGQVDIVIGTHRLVSKDVVFKNLGLIIIDEEQRFGVRAKEHLKKAKVGVECLTLSATPIPRTLYMSLMGARDLSVINTPPQDRMPIKTMITELNDDLIKTALLRELARDGQAYVIHNRVETIFHLANRIKKLLPQAKVIVCHGQMSSIEIDRVFHAFKTGEADILVATTIVENGIDIPNANTILIDKADRFGLANLYQLRGRVGRWNRRAYCYFLVPKPGLLPEITRKRLTALAESSGYGGGMKVALRDLEIRGAGDILGTEQSGQVATVGFHQYCKWLKRAVRTLQGKTVATITDTKIEIRIDARLPEDYVNEVSLRMEFYQRFGEAVSWEEVDQIHEELQDRFGPPPGPTEWLYHLSRVRVYANTHGFILVKTERVSARFELKGKLGPIVKQILFAPTKSPQEWSSLLISTMVEMTEQSQLNSYEE